MSGQLETAADEGSKEADQVKRWLREIDLADREESKWRERAQKIIDLYRDEKERAENETSYRFNILFANTEVLKGALYSQCPTPDVRRRFLDRDPVGKTAAQVVQRGLSYSNDCDDFDHVMKDCVEDMALPGRGQAWVRYKPHMKDGQVVYEDVESDYVEWDMFRYSPAKRWKKVRWVARGELLTRDDCIREFGEKIGKQVRLDVLPKGMENTEENQLFKRALVWVIWNKPDRMVYVVSKGYEAGYCKKEKDPLRLEHFFPCPRPVYDIKTTTSLIPVPEYTIYQDLALQLEGLAERIAVLTDALRRRGVYDASIKELERLRHAGDNDFIPVEDYAKLVEKGGIEMAFQELPIEALANVLTQLMEQAELKKQAIYEIIGLSDIMRGTTKATETLGAQQLKSQYGEIRIGPRQAEVQRFARDIMRLKAEIICEHFSPQTLAMMTGLELCATEQEKAGLIQLAQSQQLPPEVDPAKLKRPSWEQVMAVLKSDKLRGFRIDIETDSTIKPQADEEQKNRTELVTAVTGFLEKAAPAVQIGAIPLRFATELLSFGVRGFKVGPALEEALDEWSESAQEQGGPNPAALAQQMAQMQQREEGLQQAEQDSQKRIAEADAAEKAAQTAAQKATDQQQTADYERVVLDKDKEVFALKEQIADMMRKLEDQARTMQDEQKAAIEQQSSSTEDKGEKMVNTLVQALDVVGQAIAQQAEALQRIEQAQQQTAEAMAQLSELASREKVVTVTRKGDGALTGRVTLQ